MDTVYMQNGTSRVIGYKQSSTLKLRNMHLDTSDYSVTLCGRLVTIEREF